MSCGIYLNHKTLIAGEVNSGKTERTLKILREFMECQRDSVAVLDLAPEKIRGIGGKLPLTLQEREKILYFSPQIVPPRLSGKDEQEIQKLARENRIRSEMILAGFRARKIDILVINDVSLYFHAGDAERLLSFIEGVSTIVINGYYGNYFGDTPLSRRERRQMEILMSRCDRVLLFSAIQSHYP